MREGKSRRDRIDRRYSCRRHHVAYVHVWKKMCVCVCVRAVREREAREVTGHGVTVALLDR
jgi:hypothetical protein